MKKTGGTVEISAVTSYNDYDAVHLCMLQRIQDITIFELTYVMDKPEMEEILYEREKPGGTRPEMGTPEYEEWRKEVLKRRRKRQLKERRKRLAIITAAMIVAVGASVGVGALKGRSEKASKEKMVSSDKQKEQTVSGEKALEAGTKNTETTSKDTLAEAELLASQYNYDKAIDLLKKAPSYDSDKKMQAAAKKYEDIKATCTAWPLEKVTHVFYHILIKDPSKAFDGDYKEADYNQVMTTIDEFNKITQTMYDKGYVMVSIKDMAKADDNGNITEGEILLPPGKTPFVLSQDDVCYYSYMDGDGYATKLIVDDKGKIRKNMWKMTEAYPWEITTWFR